jgi:hypothetical protein
MVGRISRGALMQELPQANPWWRTPCWATDDPHLSEVATAPFTWTPTVLDDVAPPNLYALRGPRRVGKSTVVKQAIARLLRQGVDPRRVFYFAADALGTYRDVINLFQTAATLFPDTADQPRYFFVDEISAVPEWQRGVKWLRDNTTNRRDCIVVTGSSARDIAAGTTFLAGRCCRWRSPTSSGAPASLSRRRRACPWTRSSAPTAARPARRRSSTSVRWSRRTRPTCSSAASRAPSSTTTGPRA